MSSVANRFQPKLNVSWTKSELSGISLDNKSVYREEKASNPDVIFTSKAISPISSWFNVSTIMLDVAIEPWDDSAPCP